MMSFSRYINQQLKTISDHEKELECRMYVKCFMRLDVTPCKQCSSLNNTVRSLADLNQSDFSDDTCSHKHGCGLILQPMTERKYLRENNENH